MSEYESIFSSNNEYLNFNKISREESKYSLDLFNVNDVDPFKYDSNYDISNKKTEFMTGFNGDINLKKEFSISEINDVLLISSPNPYNNYNDIYLNQTISINETSSDNSNNNINKVNEINNDLLITNNENNNKNNNDKTFKITSKEKEERLDYLIKKLKTLVSDFLHERLNKNKKCKFYKMDSKAFTSVTSYKKNKIWFDCPISELLCKFNEKNKKIINKLFESKHEQYNDIKNILNSTYEEFILNNYQDINKDYQKFFNENYKNSIMLRDYNSIQNIIKKIKNKL